MLSLHYVLGSDIGLPRRLNYQCVHPLQDVGHITQQHYESESRFDEEKNPTKNQGKKNASPSSTPSVVDT